MITAITVVHVLTCFILVVIVLLQTGKGADMGAVFGGGSSATLFGSSGAGNLLTKVTTGAAFMFMVTSLVLAYSSARRTPDTIFDRTAVGEEEVADKAVDGIAIDEVAEETAAGEAPEAAATATGEVAVESERDADAVGTEAAAPADEADAKPAAGRDAPAEPSAGKEPAAQP